MIALRPPASSPAREAEQASTVAHARFRFSTGPICCQFEERGRAVFARASRLGVLAAGIEPGGFARRSLRRPCAIADKRAAGSARAFPFQGAQLLRFRCAAGISRRREWPLPGPCVYRLASRRMGRAILVVVALLLRLDPAPFRGAGVHQLVDPGRSPTSSPVGSGRQSHGIGRTGQRGRLGGHDILASISARARCWSKGVRRQGGRDGPFLSLSKRDRFAVGAGYQAPRGAGCLVGVRLPGAGVGDKNEWIALQIQDGGGRLNAAARRLRWTGKSDRRGATIEPKRYGSSDPALRWWRLHTDRAWCQRPPAPIVHALSAGS